MKKHLIKLTAILACLQGLAWHSVDRQGSNPRTVSTAEQLVSAFSPQHAQLLPAAYKKAAIKDLSVSRKVLQFTINGVLMRYEWIGERARLIKFNGRVFSAQDLQSETQFRKAFFSKFGVSKRSRVSLDTLIFSRALANIDSTIFDDGLDSDDADEPSPNANPEEPESGSAFVFEGQEDFTTYLASDSVFREDASLADTEVGRRFESVVDLTTGSNLMAMAKHIFLFQGALAFAMNPAGGFTPGMGIMNNIGTAPSSVPFPF